MKIVGRATPGASPHPGGDCGSSDRTPCGGPGGRVRSAPGPAAGAFRVGDADHDAGVTFLDQFEGHYGGQDLTLCGWPGCSRSKTISVPYLPREFCPGILVVPSDFPLCKRMIASPHLGSTGGSGSGVRRWIRRENRRRGARPAFRRWHPWRSRDPTDPRAPCP